MEEQNESAADSGAGSESGPGPVTPMTNDERNMCVLAHILGIFTQFVGPLIIWLLKKDESPEVARHSLEVLNFEITLALALFSCIVLTLILVGPFLIPLVMLWGLVNLVMGAVAASKGEFRPYPLTLRLLT